MGSFGWDFEPRDIAFSLRISAEFDPCVGAAVVSIPWLDATGAPAAAPVTVGPLEDLPVDARRGRSHRPGARRAAVVQELGTLAVSRELVEAIRTSSLPVQVQIKDEAGQDIQVKSDARVHLGPLLLASSRAAADGDAADGEAGSADDDARQGPSKRPWPTEVSATLTDTIGLAGLYRLELQVVTDVPLLSEEMLHSLMPACFMVDTIRGLPNESWLPDKCDDVYVEVLPQLSRATSALYDAFPRARSVDRPHGVTARFSEPVVWFLGSAPLHVVREWLQHDGIVVEVHDRDCEENLRELTHGGGGMGEEEEDEAAEDKESVHRGGVEMMTCDNLGALLDRHGEVESRKPHPHGEAKFPLGQLVQMQTLRLALRAEINPRRSDKKKRMLEAMTSGLRAGGLLDTEKGERIVAQRSQVNKREDTTDYHGGGAVITMQVGLAVPVPDSNAIHERELGVKQEGWVGNEQPYDAETHPGIFAAGWPREEGGKFSAPFRAKFALPDGTEVIGPWRDTLDTACVDERAMRGTYEEATAEPEEGEEAPPPPAPEELEALVRGALAAVEAPPQNAADLRFERYGRAVLVVDESELDIVQTALKKVVSWNAEVKGINPDSAEVNTYKLTDEEQEDPYLDVLTGFAVLDGKSRVMVFEGLRDKGLQALLEALGHGGRYSGGAGYKLLSNPSLGFSQRLYAAFGSLKLPQIKVRAPLEKLARKPNLYAVTSGSGVDAHEAGEAIKALIGLKQAARLSAVRGGAAFPKAVHLQNLQILYGGFMTDAEMEARVPTPAGAAVAGRMGQTASLTACASAPTLASASQQVDVATLRPGALADATARDLVLPAVGSGKARRKAHTEMRNTHFETTLELRKSESAPNFQKANKREVKQKSDENTRTNPLGKVKNRETPFLEGQQVYLYSGQKLNCAELQKEWMRQHMDKEQTRASWTYNEDYLSCGFEFSGAQEPGVCRHQSEKGNDTYANLPGDDRAKWRNPPPRPKEEFRKPGRDICPGRREFMTEAFIDNEFESLRLCEGRAKPLAVHVRFEPDKVPHHRTITDQPFDPTRMKPNPRDFGPKDMFESVHYHGRMPSEDRYSEALRHNTREQCREAEKIRGTHYMKMCNKGATRHGVSDTDRCEHILKDAPSKRLRGDIDHAMPVTIRNEEEYHELGHPAKEWHARLRENDASPPFEPMTGTYLKRDPEVGLGGKRSFSSGTLTKAPWRHGAPPLSQTQKAGNYVSAKDFNNTRPPPARRNNESHVWKKNSRHSITNDDLRKLPYQRPADYGVAAHVMA